jgi:hypothetical protein
MKWMGHVSRIRDIRDNNGVFVWINERNKPLEKPRCRWEDIDMNLKEIGWERIYLAKNGDKQQNLVKAVINLRGSIECIEFLEQLRN